MLQDEPVDLKEEFEPRENIVEKGDENKEEDA